METPLRELLRRLGRVAHASDPEVELDESGLDRWEYPVSPVDGTEREGIVDARSGARLTTTVYAASYQAPVDYPAGWPFLVEQESAYAIASDTSQELRFLVWPDPGAIDEASRRITEQQESDGWMAHPIGAEPRTVGTWSRRLLDWYSRDDRYRLLSVVEYDGTTALCLVEGSHWQLWPAESEHPDLVL